MALKIQNKMIITRIATPSWTDTKDNSSTIKQEVYGRTASRQAYNKPKER